MPPPSSNDRSELHAAADETACLFSAGVHFCALRSILSIIPERVVPVGLWLAVSGAAVAMAQQAAPPGDTGRESSLVSPEVGPDRRVTFRLIAPAAKSAAVTHLAPSPSQAVPSPVRGREAPAAGGLVLPMRKTGDVWTVTSEPLKPDIYAYQLTVDGKTFNDPANARFIEEFDGALTSTFSVPGALWTTTGAPEGAISRHSYPSAAIGGIEEYSVYTPPGYDAKRAEPYPAVFLLHGMGDGTRTWITNGGVDITLNNLIAQGQARPMVVVMPLGYGAPTGEVKLQNFERALIEEVIPRVEAGYHLSRSRNGRAIAGVSMGGAQAMSIGLGHADTFASIGSFSGAFQMAPLAPFQDPTSPVLLRGRFDLIYVGWGAADSLAPLNRELTANLAARGVDVTRVEVPDLGHVWPLWRQMVGEMLRLVFQPR